DTARFRPDILTAAEREAGRARYGIARDRKVIIYLGLLAPHQGTGVLLDSIQRVLAREPRAFFLIGGFPGNELYRLHAERLGLGAATSFPGCIPYESAAEFLALGDLAVGPKLSQTEGNGKLYNYSAMGLPTVAFDTPANREILGNDGLYAPLGNADALADGLLHLLAHPAEAAARGRALRQRAVRQLSWDARIDDLLRVYSRLLAAPVSGASPTPTSKRYARSTHTTGEGDD
ncbi:MAG TPA: glycosyltransferase family 4 protein, partial [Thermomicrobiales bacterium]|nr:glycosyltransferase family 4 protein [Thermomicrobiales bacterium]